MKVAELEKALIELGVDPLAFSINGARDGEDQLRLENDRGLWYLYYYERGQRHDRGLFYYEEEACTRLYEILKNDSIARRR